MTEPQSTTTPPRSKSPSLPSTSSSSSTPLTDSAKKAVTFAPAESLTTTSAAAVPANSTSASTSSAANLEDPSATVSTSSSFSTPTRSHPAPPQPKRRRSSLKQGIKMPVQPPSEHWKHADPLLRRLRLRDPLLKGEHANLQKTFRDAKVVLFMFGATWPGMIREPYTLLEQFARRNPHRCKVIYVSIDTSEAAYQSQIQGKPWLAMEWNDGSSFTGGADDAPSEPFLLAGDNDLEEELHQTDPSGSLYTRPYSRVFLAEKYQVLGVPSLMVYHVEKREVLTTHARFDLLKPERVEATWAKWEKGERIDLTIADFLNAMKWTFAAGAAAGAYLVAVHVGGAPDVVRQWSEHFTRSFLSR